MPEDLDPKNVDKRIASRHIRGGRLDEKAWDKYLKSLPDSAEKSISVDTVMNDDIDDEVDEDGEE